MLVKAKHYSVTYPDGGHKIGDIFNLTKEQAGYYVKLGWVEILPDELQDKKKGRKKVDQSTVDLSKSTHDGRYLSHVFK